LTDGSDCLPTIRCRCGFEFLLLSDVQVMGQALEKYALEHAEKYGLAQEQIGRLKDYLVV
jgi:hypothetical protein